MMLIPISGVASGTVAPSDGKLPYMAGGCVSTRKLQESGVSSEIFPQTSASESSETSTTSLSEKKPAGGWNIMSVSPSIVRYGLSMVYIVPFTFSTIDDESIPEAS